MNNLITRPEIKQRLASFCKKNHIKKLALFGSYSKKTTAKPNDIDFLIEFHSGHVPGYLRLAGMEIELSRLLGGMKVDLRTAQELSRYFREQVISNALIQYAE